MVNINLTTSGEEKKDKVPFKKGLITIIVIILIGIIAYWGLAFYKDSVVKKKQLILEEQRQKKEMIEASKNKDIFDFQTRLITADSLVSKKNASLDGLNKIQELIISGVYLNSFEYGGLENGRLLLTGSVTDYGTLAKQVLGLKKSGYFSNIIIAGAKKRIEVSEKGSTQKEEIDFSLKMTIN